MESNQNCTEFFYRQHCIYHSRCDVLRRVSFVDCTLHCFDFCNNLQHLKTCIFTCNQNCFKSFCRQQCLNGCSPLFSVQIHLSLLKTFKTNQINSLQADNTVYGSVMSIIPLSAQASTRLRGVSATGWTVERVTGFSCTGGAVVKDDDDDDGGSNRDGLVLSLMKTLNCA